MKQIEFYNTLTHRVEPFEPIDPPYVSMYNCGPTVYDFATIGNFRSFLFADVLRRFLELAGYQVTQVMNITDVGHMTEDAIADGGGEDKMALAVQRMKAAKKSGKVEQGAVENPSDPYQVAAYFTDAFLRDARALGMKVADEPDHLPRATDYIRHMVEMIQRLVANGAAYVADDGAVYFSVEAFPDYGKLSGNTLERLRGGAGGRVLDEHQSAKKHPADFLLWKPDQSHLMKWDSPFGTGYPGWHIECSSMAMEVLGREQIDIHTGGEDNIFPHHECEIAQSRCATGKPSFARYWLHARFLLVEGQKMSKSKGNFFTLRDLTKKGIDPVVIRYELIKGHYRSNMNFTMKGLEDAASAVGKVRDTVSGLEEKTAGVAADVGLDHPAVARFADALADDLNVAGALGALFEYLPHAGADPAEGLGVIRKMDSVLAILPTGGPSGEDHGAGEQCAALDAARKAKDYATADRIRQQLIDEGYEVKTTAQGTVATKRLA